METLKLLVLAITQGISELLPISSSGHLIIIGGIMNIPTSTLLLTSLHIGTSMALILFFWKQLFSNLFSKKRISFLFKVLISALPAGIIGILFESKIEEFFRVNIVIGISLILWGIVMIIIEHAKIQPKYTDSEQIPWKKSLIIGISQALAVIPGTSRSGITTIAGVLLGLDKYTALEYGLILGLPILVGSSAWEILKTIMESSGDVSQVTSLGIVNIGIILVIPFLVGYISLVLLKKVGKEKWLTAFGIYRILAGIVVLLITLF